MDEQIKHLRYIGKGDLHNRLALVFAENPTDMLAIVQAQFDFDHSLKGDPKQVQHPHCFGWHAYPRTDFIQWG